MIPGMHEMTEDTSRVVEQDVCFIVQRTYLTPGGKTHWVDSSGSYYEGSGGEKVAIELRNKLRETFGKENVRAVRRELIVTETTVED